MKCRNCGYETSESYTYCQNCGASQKEKVEVGWPILSFFVPIAGLILYILKKDSQPRTAKMSGICALVSFCLSIVMSIVTAILCVGLFLNSVNHDFEVFDEYYEYTEVDKEIVHGDEVPYVSEEWMAYEFCVDGNYMSLPCSYAKFSENAGLYIGAEDAVLYAAANEFVYVNLYAEDGSVAAYAYLYNETSANALYEDCVVVQICQASWDMSYNTPVITFPGSIQVGVYMSIEELKEIFGEPTSIYHDESMADGCYCIIYAENGSDLENNYMEFYYSNGLIGYIVIDKTY